MRVQTYPIYRSDHQERQTGRLRLVRLVRTRVKRKWGDFLRSKRVLHRMLVTERARGDRLAVIERSSFLFPAIRKSNGNLVLSPAPPRTTSRRRVKDRVFPRLYQYPEGHERAGQLQMLLNPRHKDKWAKLWRT